MQDVVNVLQFTDIFDVPYRKNLKAMHKSMQLLGSILQFYQKLSTKVDLNLHSMFLNVQE